MSFSASTDGSYQNRHQWSPDSIHFPLPNTEPGSLKQVAHYVERKLVNYLRDVGAISTFPDEIEDEAGGECPELPEEYPELHRDAYESWWGEVVGLR